MKLILAPEPRPPFFDGWKTDKARYRFDCVSCNAKIEIRFGAMLEAAWSWKEKMKEEDRNAVAADFGIDLANRSIATGMNAVVQVPCPKCGLSYFCHFRLHEYRHSCYEISVRAIAHQ